MTPYRIYLLTTEDHIAYAREAECATDQDAAIMAAKVIDGFPAVEIWEGKRIVGRITAVECRALRNPPQSIGDT